MKIRKNNAGLTTFMKSARGPILSERKPFGSEPQGRRRVEGFTLIELMVVISIIAVLSTVGLVIYSGVQSKARDSVRKNNLNNLATALELYNQTKGAYVTDDLYSNLDISNFMNGSMPLDPRDKSQYYYTSTPNGQIYTLCANLENTSDSDINNPTNCPGYNYGVVPK